MSEEPSSGLSYSQAGVDIDKAAQAKRRIREMARSTFDARVVTDIGSFAGIFRPDFGKFDNPVLLSSADGVGTKLKVAFMCNIHNTVGIDLVAHCTNDVLVMGAVPMFFLDYIATGKLDPGVVAEIVEGVAQGCRQAGCVLLGGETAEMPDFYQPGEYDLAGFIVGIADEDRIYRPSLVQEGDRLIGLPSSGLHTNGYSLVRKLFFEQEKLTVNDFVPELDKTVGEELLTPHKNYLQAVQPLIENRRLKGIAHITGGGITENLNRVLPPDLDAFVDTGAWTTLPIFRYIQDKGGVSDVEMFRTFNMGLGMILVVSATEVDQILSRLADRSESGCRMGEIRRGSGKVVYR